MDTGLHRRWGDVGAIGGFVLEGIIGLFVGAVALAVTYRLFQEWLAGLPAASEAGEAG